MSTEPAPGVRPGGRGARARRIAASSWFLGAVVAVLSSRPWNPTPGVGLDPSWQSALHMAARTGIDFGGDLNFTYGPLGFLAAPSLYFTSTWALAVAFNGLVHLATSVLLLSSARAALGLPAALVCTYLAVRLLVVLDAGEVAPLAALVAAMALLAPSQRVRGPVVVFGAALSALVLAVKFNSGLMVLVIVLVLAWLAPSRWWRASLAVFACFGASLLALWLATGNAVRDLPGWLAASGDITSAYSAAMGAEAVDRAGDFLLLVPATVIVAAATWGATREWPRDRRAAAASMVAVFLFVAFKRGFVHHDAHSFGFFALLPSVVLVLRAQGLRTLVAFALLVAMFVGVTPYDEREFFDPVRAVDSLRSAASHAASPSLRAQRIEAARAAQRAAYALDDGTVRALAGKTVHVDPWEASVLWAYPELRWRPLPVFQSYAAYAAGLDGINASALRSPDGPQRILRHGPHAIHARNPDFESPAAVQAMVCGYRQVHATERWQVLARSAPACGAERRLASVTAPMGATVPVPPAPGPGFLVFARIRGMDGGVGHRIFSALYKAAETYMVTGDGRRFRLVPGTAAGPLLMSAPDLGYDARFGFSSPIREFLLEQRRGLGTDGVTVEFSAMAFTPPAAARD